jgi:GxxExxY protein
VRPNEVSYQVIGAAMTVHSAMGAGLLESVYDTCLCREFARRRLPFQHQVPMAVSHDHVRISPGYRVDFIVDGCVIVEIKSVEKLLPLHRAQLLTYLRLSTLPLGLLLNFKVAHLRDGISRVVNAPEADL